MKFSLRSIKLRMFMKLLVVGTAFTVTADPYTETVCLCSYGIE